LEISNKMDERLKEKLRKEYIDILEKKQSAPPLATKEVPPLPVLDLLLQPLPTNEDLHLNIDVPSMVGNINMVVGGQDVKYSFCEEIIIEEFENTI
jgi:hypothetical protein